MRIKELHLKNWKVVREANFLGLSDFVVIAGPNGVGKTKVKEAIMHIFQNSGNPPAGSSVALEATNDEEKKAWGKEEVSLPQTFWGSFFNTQQKKLKTKSRLIQIDSNRNIDSINFQSLTFNQIGNPEDENVGYDYGVNHVRGRFEDICRTLHRLKSKEVTSVYNEYQKKVDPQNPSVLLKRLDDSTEKYLNMFNNLLYPKKMLPIDINSTTIQYLDDDDLTRSFSELSSGEREVVILTFDLLAQNPSDCIVLIDEPEVHLHPELTYRLLKSLKSIGERNQFFMFTHSPDIIGSSFDTGIHFIRPKVRVPNGNQVVRVDEKSLDELKTIPNIRETIGMISVGKKLLFVEGKPSSIDRKIFATIAKGSKIDLAIVPSESCTTINNMALMCETLEKGLFGVDICLIRDRDSLQEKQIEDFKSKSKGKLLFLPFYHIENAFLKPKAIWEVSQKILTSRSPSEKEIEDFLIQYAKDQINFASTLYVKNEIQFSSGQLDLTPDIDLNKSSLNEIKSSMIAKRDAQLDRYRLHFSDDKIEERLNSWKCVLEKSIQNGWSEDARKFFIGKRLLKDIQGRIFGTKMIQLWEHVLIDEGEGCRSARSELESLMENI